MSMAERLARHNEAIRDHFEGLAAAYPALKKRNAYYNDYLVRWCRSLVPPGRRVLDIGSGRGDVLAAVQPGEGLGLDVSAEMTRRASIDFPALQFQTGAVEDFVADRPFDAALLINTLEYTYDVGLVLDRARAALRDNGKLLISTANPIWSPVFRTASKLGLRIPDCERMFLTNEDVANLLHLHGFEPVYKRMDLILPKGGRLLADAVNWGASRTPYLRMLSSMQLIMARKVPEKRREYSVSIVVPCHNEVDGVDRCVREITKLGTSTEVIFVDDGSTDGTAKAIDPSHSPGCTVKVISYSPNEGKGRAVKRGFDAATGDILVIMDADLTTHPEELGPLYEAFAEGRAEFVNCTRLVYPMDSAAMKFKNYVGNKAFTIAVSLIMGARVSDTLCGTKAMFRWDYQHMTMGRDPWGDYDFLFGAAQQRLVLRELPVHYRDRVFGMSKMAATKHTINLLRMCLRGFGQVQTMRPIPPRRVGVR
jgi:SAM-dependent methyltransferase